MRKLTLLALPLLSLSCTGSRWDGVYQVLLSLSSWNCTGDTQLYDEGAHESDGTRLSVRHTTANNMVVSIGNMILAGPRDGSSFSVSASSGSTDSSCNREYGRDTTFAGEFTKDLGISGTVSIEETDISEGCGGQDHNETCTVNWTVEGILIQVLEDRHGEHAQWGYMPGSGY